MFSEFGRKITDNIENTNLIGFTNVDTHVYEIWYLVKINDNWCAVNNSGIKFINGEFLTKEELILFLKNKNIKNLQMYYLDKKYYVVKGNSLFKHTIKFVKEEYEKQYKTKVKYISDEVL